MRAAITALAASSLLAACSPMKDLPQAQAGIAAFHKSLNAADFAGIYAGASKDMKSTATPDAVNQLLTSVHTNLGNFQSGNMISWKDNVENGDHFVSITYASKFDRGSANEDFIYRLDNSGASLAGYHITSKP
jgi:hypothetical protein